MIIAPGRTAMAGYSSTCGETKPFLVGRFPVFSLPPNPQGEKSTWEKLNPLVSVKPSNKALLIMVHLDRPFSLIAITLSNAIWNQVKPLKKAQAHNFKNETKFQIVCLNEPL